MTPSPSVIEYDAMLSIDLALYPSDVLLRACYRLTDRFYVFVSYETDQRLSVSMTRKPAAPASQDPLGELSNLLIDESVRQQIRVETAALRDDIVRCALAEVVRHG